MAVNWAHIIEPKLFKKRAASEKSSGVFFRFSCLVRQKLWQFFVQLFCRFTQGSIGATGYKSCQIMAHGACWRGNRHIIVIQNYNLTCIHAARIVHGLVRHSSCNRTISNDGHNIALHPVQPRCFGHAQTCGNGCGRMRSTERIIFAFAAFGET